METQWLGRKPRKLSLTSEFPLPGLNTGWGNQPLRIYLWRTKTPLIQFYFPAPTGRSTNPFKPTEYALAPPYHLEMTRIRRTPREAQLTVKDCLISLIDWQWHWLTQTNSVQRYCTQLSMWQSQVRNSLDLLTPQDWKTKKTQQYKTQSRRKTMQD